MKPELGISDRGREGAVELLNALLSDEFLLYTKTRNYHWNVVGPLFGELHRFLDDQYQALNAIVDEVAERSRSLGGRSFGTLAEFLKHARLKERPGQVLDAGQMIESLLGDHEAIIRTLREDQATCLEKFGDVGTNNFLVDLLERHEKMAWMLRAHLEAKGI